MFFLRRLRPLEVSGERVLALRISLNAPVLSTPDLPIGPARALIVAHREGRGQFDATVGVRSLQSGAIAYWSCDGELASEDDLAGAADAALNFAESLGFLFDDAALAGADAAKAWRSWRASESPGPASTPDGLLGEAELPELELGDLILEDAIAASPPPRSTAPQAPAMRTLSKFRPRDAAPALAPARAPAPSRKAPPTQAKRNAPARQPLAKLQLVKRRSPEEERKLLLRRLLTSF